MTDVRFTYDDLQAILVDDMAVEAEALTGPETTFDELGLDSLAGAELQVVLLTKFGIETDEDVHALRSVQETLDYLNQQTIPASAG